MELGFLIKSKIIDATVQYHGHVKTMEITIKEFELVRNPYKTAEKTKQPDFYIHVTNRNGDKIKMGAAWLREFERDGIISEMMSLTFDDPSFEAPLNVTAFKGDDEYRWPITWRRRANPSTK